MKIFYINLDKDLERRNWMERQLSKQGLMYERIPAVFGREISKEYLEKCYSRRLALLRQSRELSFAEIGVAMSHLRTYHRIIEQELPYALILEDDVIIPNGFCDLIEDLERLVRVDRPEVHLLSPAHADMGQSSEIRSYGNCQASKFVYGYYASSYIVTRLAAQSLLIELYPISIVADNWKRLDAFKVVDIFVISPCLIIQDQDTFGSSTTEDYKGFSNTREEYIYKARRLRCVIIDFLQSVWRRKFHIYNDVIKKNR